MPVIKRYVNRKLYNTETKQYVTLDEIANLIRQGEEVRVIDNATGEDLTALTLSQIIFEQEKKSGGFLPQSVLTGLVQAGGDTLSSLRRTLAKPLNLLHHVDEEISQRIQSLVTRGELDETEGQHLLAKLVGDKFRWYDDWQLSEEELLQLLHKHGVPTHADLEQLNTQLEALATQIERLGQPETFDRCDSLNPEENTP